MGGLTNHTTDIRLCAAGVLSRFRDQGELIVPALVACLDDPDKDFRASVPPFLAAFGPKAAPAIPKLLKMAESPHLNEDAAAARTLICLDAEGTLLLFVEKLKSADPAIRARYAVNLRYFEHRGQAAVPGLLNCLRDHDKAVRLAATISLGEIGEDPDLVVPALVATLEDEDLWVRTFAGIALGTSGSRAEAAIPGIRKLIEEHGTNQSYQIRLRDSLRHIAPNIEAGKAEAGVSNHF